MPRTEAENQIYYDLIKRFGLWSPAFLDITEVLPVTSPRSWVFRDGSPVTWFNWAPNEPNNDNHVENHVEIGWKWFGGDYQEKWNDMSDMRDGKAVCVYYMPPGAQNICPWLNDYGDQ